jgi:dTDP-4-dehydrorhamnose reductase
LTTDDAQIATAGKVPVPWESKAHPVRSTKPSVLVLGATGMLGHVVANHLGSAGFEVHASIRNPSLAGRLSSVRELHHFDAARDSVAKLIGATSPKAVVNCIGLVKQLEAASKPLPAIRLNALFPHQVAASCESIGARLVHISTDCVFSGSLPIGKQYTEAHTPDAHDLYGLTKYLGEVRTPGSVTLRTSIIGWELERSSGLLEWFAAQTGGRVDGFRKAIFSGLTTRALAEIVGKLIIEYPQLSGLYHVSSEPITKYELLLTLRDTLLLDVDIDPVDEPTINRALSSERQREVTGIVAPSWIEMLAEYKRERKDLVK